MMNLRKNFHLKWLLLTLFLVQAVTPVALASSVSTQKIDGIVICTTTGLKVLNPQGDLVPVGEYDQGLVFEHCHACFTSTFFGNLEASNHYLVDLLRLSTRKKQPASLGFRNAFLVISPFAARAPPA